MFIIELASIKSLSGYPDKWVNPPSDRGINPTTPSAAPGIALPAPSVNALKVHWPGGALPLH